MMILRPPEHNRDLEFAYEEQRYFKKLAEDERLSLRQPRRAARLARLRGMLPF